MLCPLEDDDNENENDNGNEDDNDIDEDDYYELDDGNAATPDIFVPTFTVTTTVNLRQPDLPRTSSFTDVPRASLVVLDIDDTVFGATNDLSDVWVVQQEVFDLMESAKYVLFITARMCFTRAHTLQHLRSIGIVAGHQHVIYSNFSTDKGKYLEAFLQNLPHLQQLDTVFVDDNQFCVSSMQSTLPHVQSFWLCPLPSSEPPVRPDRTFVLPSLSPP